MDSSRKNIRNICILAHVDHGKTTLADHLISAAAGGGLVHPKMAGKLRFMDYLDEEQRRAITMKSSSVTLHYNDCLINLIDSPGHMDFCSEVSTAARLSDGALILVDAVEGVHIQTHAVLRQAWIEKLTPCLVLNKIDRLISELKFSPLEAYNRLSRIIHEVNGIISMYKSEKYLSDVDSVLVGSSTDLQMDTYEILEDDDEDAFNPQKGNVVFVCALDGWGFGINEFAKFYASKLGASSVALRKALWGPWYYNSKTKKIVGKKAVNGGGKSKPMFVQFVLEPLWQLHSASLEPGNNSLLLEKIIKSFNLNVAPRDLQNKDPKAVLQAVLCKWLPLSDVVLSMVVKRMPDPIAAQASRISRLLPKREILDIGIDTEVLEEANLVRKAVESCDSSSEAPCVAFVTKMFAVQAKMIPRVASDGENLISHDYDSVSDERFLAFARIFSGVFRPGQRIFVLSALYDPLNLDSTHKHVQEVELGPLYTMMGQNLNRVSSAEAGSIVAIQGLGHHILKTATLSSTKNCWPFSSMSFQVSPTLRVAIEPSDPSDMSALLKGLKLLNRSDPFVEVSISSRGEHVLTAAGEVHLQRCIKDLHERFAKVSLEVSPPLVSYRETIAGDSSKLLENLKSLSKKADIVEKTTPHGRFVVVVRAMKLPPSLIKVLDESANLLEEAFSGKLGKEKQSLFDTLRKRIMDSLSVHIASLGENDTERAQKYTTKWQKLLKRIWALGPRQVGPNILFTPDFKRDTENASCFIHGYSHLSKNLGLIDDKEAVSEASSKAKVGIIRELEGLQNAVVSGFQLASASGPLCEEPMWGMAFVVEVRACVQNEQSEELLDGHPTDQYGMFAGQVMATVKEACKAIMLQKKPRLVEGMYFCELSTPTEHLGSMYAVLNRRRARILKEEMQEGSPLFIVHSYIPVSESFGFADELRRWTSGAASALLVFSHWEELPEDPFFVPKTEEEIEEFGDGSSVLPNTARKLIDAVRRRKGLPVEEKIVPHATKQRTLARKV